MIDTYDLSRPPPARSQPPPLDSKRLDSLPIRCEAGDSMLQSGPSTSQLVALK